MSRDFHSATAEQVVKVVEAVVAFGNVGTAASIATFTDFSSQQTGDALGLAADLGLVKETQGSYEVNSPMCRLFRSPHAAERSGALRVVIEEYEPFTIFREELDATGDTDAAATRTRARLDITAHRENVKDTLLSLATYTNALVARQGGQYQRNDNSIRSAILELQKGVDEEAAAVQFVREKLTEVFANELAHDSIIRPLAVGLRHSIGQLSREAIVHAGNAVESFLTFYGNEVGVNVANHHGINSKLEGLRQQQQVTTKHLNMGKYVGHIRNAADHGDDAEINAAWQFNPETGYPYTITSIHFIRSMMKRLRNNDPEL